ncbi:MAG: M48 family metalloprotease [Elusimicrobiota bacterium]
MSARKREFFHFSRIAISLALFLQGGEAYAQVLAQTLPARVPGFSVPVEGLMIGQGPELSFPGTASLSKTAPIGDAAVQILPHSYVPQVQLVPGFRRGDGAGTTVFLNSGRHSDADRGVRHSGVGAGVRHSGESRNPGMKVNAAPWVPASAGMTIEGLLDQGFDGSALRRSEYPLAASAADVSAIKAGQSSLSGRLTAAAREDSAVHGGLFRLGEETQGAEFLRLSGLEGRADLSGYRVPLGLRMRHDAGVFIHWSCLAASVFVLGYGIGIPVLASATAWLYVKVWLAYRRFVPPPVLQAPPAVLTGQEDRVRGVLGALWERLGFAKEILPDVLINDSGGDFGARTIRERSSSRTQIVMGQGLAAGALALVAGVLAHELGHLVSGDFGRGKIFQSLEGAELFWEIFVGLAWRSAVLVEVRFLLGWAAWGTLLSWPMAMLAALPLACVGLLAGFSARRAEELRADHFSAWLTKPLWLRDYLQGREDLLREYGPEPLFSRIFGSWLRTHPSHAARIRRLNAFSRGIPQH